MSEVYREETRDENGSSEGSHRDHDVGIETDDFVWEDDLITSTWRWRSRPKNGIYFPSL